MVQNAMELGTFIHWVHGENYPFSACMKKLMEILICFMLMKRKARPFQ